VQPARRDVYFATRIGSAVVQVLQDLCRRSVSMSLVICPPRADGERAADGINAPR
jgi:hypothetical protein